VSRELGSRSFGLALSIAETSRCCQRRACRTRPRHLCPNRPPKTLRSRKYRLSQKDTPGRKLLHFTLCSFLPPFPLFSSKRVFFWVEQSVENQDFLKQSRSAQSVSRIWRGLRSGQGGFDGGGSSEVVVSLPKRGTLGCRD